MNIDQMHIFREIAHSGSVSQASRNLFISQSSLSRTLQNVEKDIGVELFDRQGKKLSLNKYGEILLHYADIAEAARDKAKEEIEQLILKNNHMVHAVFRHPFGNSVHAFKRFLIEQPHITPVINWIDIPENENFTVEFNVSVQKPDESQYTIIGQDYYMIAVSRQHPLYTKSKKQLNEQASIHLSDLDGTPFVACTAAHLNEWAYTLFSKSGIHPEIIAECPQVWGSLQYVDEGLGYMLGIGSTTFNGIDNDTHLRKIPLVGIEERPWLSYRILPSDDTSDEASKIFSSYICEYLEAQIYMDSEIHRIATKTH